MRAIPSMGQRNSSPPDARPKAGAIALNEKTQAPDTPETASGPSPRHEAASDQPTLADDGARHERRKRDAHIAEDVVVLISIGLVYVIIFSLGRQLLNPLAMHFGLGLLAWITAGFISKKKKYNLSITVLLIIFGYNCLLASSILMHNFFGLKSYSFYLSTTIFLILLYIFCLKYINLFRYVIIITAFIFASTIFSFEFYPDFVKRNYESIFLLLGFSIFSVGFVIDLIYQKIDKQKYYLILFCYIIGSPIVFLALLINIFPQTEIYIYLFYPVPLLIMLFPALLINRISIILSCTVVAFIMVAVFVVGSDFDLVTMFAGFYIIFGFTLIFALGWRRLRNGLLSAFPERIRRNLPGRCR
ncbi:MAG: hypothetical protein HLUCCO17_01510 [Saliniramus fredricksonii]|uniref:Uncharacterized protein n=2 Tax=Saliniramus fredricksonii TaxID=1653334 RepID=A0A0N8KF06_9HYPH|nr:MAG: hypothetical protein HLUCCO17_01510 [Saliniramus fredricksonii]